MPGVPSRPPDPAVPNLAIRALEPALVDDYFAFFDRDAFADFPWWAGCYCGFYHDPSPEWDPSSQAGPRNRALKAERIRRGEAHGLLAYADGKVVGWCNAGPRAAFQNLRRYAVAIEDPDEPVGSIMCFVIAAPYRGRGVATALLDAACGLFGRMGLTVAEGYPVTAPPQGPYADQTPWTAHNYHGPLSMFLRAGFVISREFERFAVVRKPLTP